MGISSPNVIRSRQSTVGEAMRSLQQSLGNAMQIITQQKRLEQEKDQFRAQAEQQFFIQLAGSVAQRYPGGLPSWVSDNRDFIARHLTDTLGWDPARANNWIVRASDPSNRTFAQAQDFLRTTALTGGVSGLPQQTPQQVQATVTAGRAGEAPEPQTISQAAPQPEAAARGVTESVSQAAPAQPTGRARSAGEDRPEGVITAGDIEQRPPRPLSRTRPPTHTRSVESTETEKAIDWQPAHGEEIPSAVTARLDEAEELKRGEETIARLDMEVGVADIQIEGVSGSDVAALVANRLWEGPREGPEYEDFVRGTANWILQKNENATKAADGLVEIDPNEPFAVPISRDEIGPNVRVQGRESLQDEVASGGFPQVVAEAMAQQFGSAPAATETDVPRHSQVSGRAVAANEEGQRYYLSQRAMSVGTPEQREEWTRRLYQTDTVYNKALEVAERNPRLLFRPRLRRALNDASQHLRRTIKEMPSDDEAIDTNAMLRRLGFDSVQEALSAPVDPSVAVERLEEQRKRMRLLFDAQKFEREFGLKINEMNQDQLQNAVDVKIRLAELAMRENNNAWNTYRGLTGVMREVLEADGYFGERRPDNRAEIITRNFGEGMPFHAVFQAAAETLDEADPETDWSAVVDEDRAIRGIVGNLIRIGRMDVPQIVGTPADQQAPSASDAIGTGVLDEETEAAVQAILERE